MEQGPESQSGKGGVEGSGVGGGDSHVKSSAPPNPPGSPFSGTDPASLGLLKHSVSI